jgi:ParB family chromosome partitioning protein
MRKALGRGLEALLPTGAAPSSQAGLLHLPVDSIAPNPDQPRRHFAGESLAELAASIRMHGLLQPLVVRRAPGGYQLIAGERRLRAARMAGLEEVPAIVRESDERGRMELALVENLQREDLPPLDEAEAYRTLMEEYDLTQEEVASRVGKSRSAVANTLRLLGLPEEVKERLRMGELTAGHARAVLSASGADAQVTLAREIAERGLPKSEVERLVAAERARPPASRPRAKTRRTPSMDPNWRAVAEDLTRKLGTRVRLIPRARGGTIEIEFYSAAELDRLVHQFDGSDR